MGGRFLENVIARSFWRPSPNQPFTLKDYYIMYSDISFAEKMTTEYFSLVGEGAGDNNLSELFQKSTEKSAPAYDYAEVDAKKKKKKKQKKEQTADLEDDLEETLIDDSDKDADAEEEIQVKKDKDMKLKSDKMAQVKHEDSKERIIDEEKEKRTVFVGNLNVNIKKPHLKKLFSKFGKVETIRFRCAGRPDMKTTKKVAVIKQTFHDERKNICAYVRMSSVEEAEASCSLNGTVVDEFTIRVDMALKDKSHDNKKSIFLGNLHFNIKEDEVRLLFSKCGDIDNVRLIRDPSTGMGKGFGYVNFCSEESVAKAVRLHQHEVGGRKVRVSRAVRKSRSAIEHKAERKIKNKKKRNNDSQGTRQRDSGGRGPKENKKSFQGVNTSRERKVVKKTSKQDKKKKVMAKILNQ